MTTELRYLVLNALLKDRTRTCHELFQATAEHLLDPKTSDRHLNQMRKDRPKFLQAIRAGKKQGQNAERIGNAMLDTKVSDGAVAIVVDQLILGDSISEDAVVRICAGVLAP